MKQKGAIIFYLTLILFSSISYGQCKPDSIISYRIVSKDVEIASIEYYQYDSNDSLIKRWLINFDDKNKPKPSYQINITRNKFKGGSSIQFETDLWNDARANFSSSSKEVQTQNKKGQLISTEIADYIAVNNKFDYVPVKRTEFVYNKAGKLIAELTYSWDNATSQWINSTKKTVSYNQQNLELETLIDTWNKDKTAWSSDWKHTYEYDSINVLSQTTTYQSVANVWLPFSKTEYGVEPLSPIKWNKIQVWNGEKREWQNQTHYVFQYSDKDLMDTEIHLSWQKDEWKIDFAVFYKYNEAGDLIQIANDSQQIIWQRFCRLN